MIDKIEVEAFSISVGEKICHQGLTKNRLILSFPAWTRIAEILFLFFGRAFKSAI
jgi:hypothetical protein